MGVPTRVENRTPGTVIGNKLDGCRQLAMLACVSIGNTTNRLPLQVIPKLLYCYPSNKLFEALHKTTIMLQADFCNVMACFECRSVDVS